MKRFLNVGTALKLCCIGFAGGALMRGVQMLYRFDYDKGFFTDGGVLSWCCFAFVLLCGLGAAALCVRLRGRFGPYVFHRGALLGTAALLSGAALLLMAGAEFSGLAVESRQLGLSLEVKEQQVVRFIFTVVSLLFGGVQVFTAFCFYLGKNVFLRAPLLYLTGVAWGIMYLVEVYIFYTRSPYFTENFFTVLGAAALLLSLFYLCRLLAGVQGGASALRLFITGIFAVVLLVTRSLSDLVPLFLGERYAGELPALCQLSVLLMALFILVFLSTYRREVILRPVEPDQGGAYTPRHGGV